MAEPVVVLRPLTLDDLDSIVQWSRDDAFCRANGWNVERVPAEVRSHWTRLIEEPPENFVRLGVEVEGNLVGYADLADIRQGQAELGIAIGDSARWGTGLGTAAAVAMLRYGFEQVGLHEIRGTTHETNVRSIALLQKIGFRRVGTLSEREEYLGELGDVIEFAISR